MAKLLSGDGHAVNIGVENPKEAEKAIFEILRTYSKWLAERSGRDAERYYKELVEQFSAQEKYAYELSQTELRRTGKMSEWTPQPLRLYVRKAWGMPEEEGRPLLVQIRDNGSWDAALD